MFDMIKRITKNVKQLSSNKILKETLQDNTQLQYDIIQLNTQKQLYEQGVFADGKPTGDYSTATIYGTSKFEGKIAKGQPYDHITFKDTGAMYDSEQLKVTNDGFVLSMDTVKNGVDLEQRDGKIVGLTDESLNEVREWVKPLFIENALKQILK